MSGETKSGEVESPLRGETEIGSGVGTASREVWIGMLEEEEEERERESLGDPIGEEGEDESESDKGSLTLVI